MTALYDILGGPACHGVRPGRAQDGAACLQSSAFFKGNPEWRPESSAGPPQPFNSSVTHSFNSAIRSLLANTMAFCKRLETETLSCSASREAPGTPLASLRSRSVPTRTPFNPVQLLALAQPFRQQSIALGERVTGVG